jgi:peptidyl-prolyl cis-trans isomerase A (cyclophilin A)
MGDITIELYPEKAPVTVNTFLRYVDARLYDSSSFFRVCTPQNESKREIKIQVIQGGNVPEKKQFAPIPIETTQQSELKHMDGTLSMARDAPNTATCEFFICINDQPELNFGGKRNPDGQGFAAFGRVIQGMDVVKKIQAEKDSAQHLLKPVMIYSIRRR